MSNVRQMRGPGAPSRSCTALLAFFGVFLSCSLAHADGGIALFIIITPVGIALLIPVVLVEAWVYRKELGLASRRAMWVSGVANSLSTFLGVPIVSASNYFSQYYVAQLIEGKVGDYALIADFYVVTKVAQKLGVPNSMFWCLALLVTLGVLWLCYQTSVWSEYIVVKRMCRPTSPAQCLAVVRRANRITYAGMIAVLTGLVTATLLEWIHPI